MTHWTQDEITERFFSDGEPVVVSYDDRTPEQKAIVDVSNLPGTLVPSGLSKEEFIKWFKARGGD